MSNIVVILDGQTLPTPNLPFVERVISNSVDNVTLNGTLYTDFVNRRRGWSLTWARLHEDDYNIIRGIFNDQYVNGAYPFLQIDYYSIIVPVRVEINDKDIQQDGCFIYGVELVLSEEFAVS